MFICFFFSGKVQAHESREQVSEVCVRRFFCSSQCPDRLWGPPSLLSNGHLGLVPRGVKRKGLEADYSPLSSAEVNKSGTILPLPHASS
jgi:hypothetical protein